MAAKNILYHRHVSQKSQCLQINHNLSYLKITNLSFHLTITKTPLKYFQKRSDSKAIILAEILKINRTMKMRLKKGPN